MDDFEIEFNDDINTGPSHSKLPDINSNFGYNKEKASNLFSAMSSAIDQEQQKRKETNLNMIDRQWNSRPIMGSSSTNKQEEEQESDSFEAEVNNDALIGQQNYNGDDSSDEFDIVDNTQAHNFKKLHMKYNDPNISSEERKDYMKKLGELKQNK